MMDKKIRILVRVIINDQFNRAFYLYITLNSDVMLYASIENTSKFIDQMHDAIKQRFNNLPNDRFQLGYSVMVSNGINADNIKLSKQIFNWIKKYILAHDEERDYNDYLTKEVKSLIFELLKKNQFLSDNEALWFTFGPNMILGQNPDKAAFINKVKHLVIEILDSNEKKLKEKIWKILNRELMKISNADPDLEQVFKNK